MEQILYHTIATLFKQRLQPLWKSMLLHQVDQWLHYQGSVQLELRVIDAHQRQNASRTPKRRSKKPTSHKEEQFLEGCSLS
jgi:hypothetical protein